MSVTVQVNDAVTAPPLPSRTVTVMGYTPSESKLSVPLNTPASNFGFLLRGDEVFDGSAKRFATKEYPVGDKRPTLVVEYTPPGVPAEAATWGAVKSLYR